MIHQRCLGDAWNWISQFFTLKFSVLGGLFYFLFFECVDLTWLCTLIHVLWRIFRLLCLALKIGRVKVIFQQLRFHLSPFAAPRTDLASFSSDLKIVLDHQLVLQSNSWLTSHFWNVNARWGAQDLPLFPRQYKASDLLNTFFFFLGFLMLMMLLLWQKGAFSDDRQHSSAYWTVSTCQLQWKVTQQ